MLVLPYGLQRATTHTLYEFPPTFPHPIRTAHRGCSSRRITKHREKKSGHRFRHKYITNHIGRIVVKSNKLDLTTSRSQSSPHIFKEWYLITHLHFIFKINKYQKKFTTTFSFHVPLDMNYNAEQPIPISPIAYKTRPFHVAHLLWNHSAIGFKITS